MGINMDSNPETFVQIITLKNIWLPDQTNVHEYLCVWEKSQMLIANYYQWAGLITPTQKTDTGKARKSEKRAYTIMKRNLKTNSRVTGRNVMENNPYIYGEGYD